MKTFLLHFYALCAVTAFSAPAFAVITADCPQLIEIALSDFQPEPKWTLEDYSYIRYLEEAKEAYAIFPLLTSIKDTVALERASNGACSYKGKFLYATLDGSLKPGAVQKARLTIRWFQDINIKGSQVESAQLVSFLPIKGISPHQLDLVFQNGYAKIWNGNEYCEEGGCGPILVPLGVANKVWVNAYGRK